MAILDTEAEGREVTKKIDQSQISGDGVYVWRAVSGIYGLSIGHKPFCIYNGKIYRAKVDIVTDITPPDSSTEFEEYTPTGVGIITGSTIKGDGTTDNPLEANLDTSDNNLIVITSNGTLLVGKDAVSLVVNGELKNMEFVKNVANIRSHRIATVKLNDIDDTKFYLYETVTKLELDGNELVFTDEKVNETRIDLSTLSGSGGASTFKALSDTPSNYIGNTGKMLVVNTNEDGLEFTDTPAPAQTISSFTELDDTPASLTGNEGKMLVVNDTGDALELTDAPTGGGGSGASTFVELTDTPDDISTDGKMLLTNGNKLVLSDLPEDCGIVINEFTKISVTNGNTITINDVQQFISQAIDKTPVQRTYGYASIKCIDPQYEIFPINKGMLEYVKTATAGNREFFEVNGMKENLETIENDGVYDFDRNLLHSFKDIDDNNINIRSVIHNGYKRIIDDNRKIYNLNVDGKYEDTGATIGSMYNYEIATCGKYITGLISNNTYRINEFTDTSANNPLVSDITLSNITSGYSNMFKNRNIVDDIVVANYDYSTKTLKIINAKIDLINHTELSSTILFEGVIDEGLYYHKTRAGMSYDRSIFAFISNNNDKLILIVKDSNNSFRVVRTDLTLYVNTGISISNDNYLIAPYGSDIKYYKLNLAPSLFCLEPRNEVLVTTYDKTADNTVLITATKYALLKADGIYIWDITANTETKIVNRSDIKYLRACATHIIYNYGADGNSWEIVDLDGTVAKSGSCSIGKVNIDIVQTASGYNYAIREFVDGDANPYKYRIKDQDDNIILDRFSTDKFSIVIKDYAKLVIERAVVDAGNGTTFHIGLLENDGTTNITTGTVYYGGVEYSSYNISIVKNNLIFNVEDANGAVSIIILCIEKLDNIIKCGLFANRKGCSNLYDTSLNNIVSMDTTNADKIVVLDYDR